MRITKVSIPADEDLRLGPITMNKLGQCILIAGKNGSGKSRLIHKVKSVLASKPRQQQIKEWKQNLEQRKKDVGIHISEITRLTNYLETNSDDDNRIASSLEQQNSYLEAAKNNIIELEGLLGWNFLETSELSIKYDYIDYVPTDLDIKDCNGFTKSQMDAYAMNIDTIGIDNLHIGTFCKIQHMQNQWFNATHPKTELTKMTRKFIEEKYEKLVEYIQMFLNTKLDRNENGDAMLFGLRLGESKLSNGQKVLLQLCVAIYAQEKTLKNIVVFLDEPENHLHPEALIEVVDKIKAAVTEGQLWIATHSVNLLAHFDPSYIWYMEKGEISYSGNLPEQVLTSLLGNEEEISRLSDFLQLPAQMASNQFAFESLFQPMAVVTGSGDPQAKQIINSIRELVEKNQKIKVADFGAGKGRLISTIHDSYKDTPIPIASWLDYYAFDMPSSDESICKSNMHCVYADVERRYFTSEKHFLEGTEFSSFDFIIMCNVFHEIDPKCWIELFSKEGLVLQSLKDDGILLIVEDQLLPAGEKPYQNGFLVFDKLQFKKLFNIKDDYLVNDARGDGRLKAHFIPKNHINLVDEKSRIDAIKSLLHTSKTNVRQLRSTTPTYKNGKLHGFWVQQLANAQLALGEFCKE